MPQPIALCLEDLAATDRSERFVRCVALGGRGPGLRIGYEGQADWKLDVPVACELWVSADDKLIAYRPQDAPSVVLARAGRSLELPTGKPVVVLDQDTLGVSGRTLRVHVHGPVATVSAPSPLPERGLSGAARMAAVVAVGAAVVGCERPVEIRDNPPEMVAVPDPTPPGSTGASGATVAPTAQPTATATVAKTGQPSDPPPIEVRDDPPEAPAE